MAQEEEALVNLHHKLDALRQTYYREREEAEKTIERKRVEVSQRQEAGRPIQRCQKGLHRCQQQLADLTARFHRRHRRLLQRFARHRARRCELEHTIDEASSDPGCRRHDHPVPGA
jgi:hypothetical protein